MLLVQHERGSESKPAYDSEAATFSFHLVDRPVDFGHVVRDVLLCLKLYNEERQRKEGHNIKLGASGATDAIAVLDVGTSSLSRASH